MSRTFVIVISLLLLVIAIPIVWEALREQPTPNTPPVGASGISSPPPEQTTVTFTSDPAGAQVFVAGRLVGETPITTSLAIGSTMSYRVVAVEPNETYDLYKPFTGTLVVEGDDAVSVWLERTTEEEQASQRDAFERQQAAQRERDLQAALGASRWRLVRDTDEITDEDRSAIVLEPIDHTLSSFYNPSFVVVCDQEWSQGVRPYIRTDDYIGDRNNRVPVDYRFDDGAPVERASWLSSNTGQAAFVPNQTRIAFFNEMMDSSRLVLRVYDYNNVSNTFTFDVAGTRAALTLLGCYQGPL